MNVLFYGQSTALAHLPVLVYDAVYAPLTHSLRIVDMLRSEASTPSYNHFYTQKCYRDSNY